MKPSVNGVARSGVLAMLGLIALGGTRIIHGILINRATDNETFGLVGVLIGIGMTAGLFLPGGLAGIGRRGRRRGLRMLESRVGREAEAGA